MTKLKSSKSNHSKSQETGAGSTQSWHVKHSSSCLRQTWNRMLMCLPLCLTRLSHTHTHNL